MTIINVRFASNFVAKAKSPKAHVQRRACGMTAEQPLQRKACEAQTMVVGAGLVVAAEQAPEEGARRPHQLHAVRTARRQQRGRGYDPSQRLVRRIFQGHVHPGLGAK
jgi:hypothetical protein